MKQISTFFISLILLFAQAGFVFAAEEHEDLQSQLSALKGYLSRMSAGPVTASLSEAETRSVIEDGVSWLLNAQEENGHFRYEYVPYDGVYLDDDNMVRQGGALFILGEAYRKNPETVPQLGQGIEKAIAYFESVSLEGKADDDFRCVSNFEGSSTCKLGATALVLTGILGYVEGNPDKKEKYQGLIEDYTSYISAAQKKEGGFSGVYRKSKGFDQEESPFSNGEALLALVRVYQYEKDEPTKEAIDLTFSYLKDKEFDSALYLWAMAALKDMQRLWPNQTYVAYAQEFTNWRMARASRTQRDRNTCAYIEGVTSAYSVLETVDATKKLLRSEIDHFNAMHSNLQLGKDDLYRVEIENGKVDLVKQKDPTRAHGGFLTAHSVPTQRIDFTQHCVSAYLQTLTDIDKAEL